jgi:hypothetical protein
MNTGRRRLRGALAATALGGAAVGLVLALMNVLPTPNLGLLGPNLVLDLLAMLIHGYSLWLAAFAVIGIALALLGRRAGFRRGLARGRGARGFDRRALRRARGSGMAYRLAGRCRALVLGVLLLSHHQFARDRDLRPAGRGGAQARRRR